MNAKKVFSLLWRDLILPVLKLPFQILKMIKNIFQIIYEKIISNLRFSITFRINSMYGFVISLVLIVLSLGILAGGFAFVMKNEGDELQKDFLLVSSFIAEAQDVPEQRIRQLAELSGTSITIFDDKQEVKFTTDQAAPIFIDKNEHRINIVEQVEQNQVFIANPARPDNTIPPEVFNEYGFALVLNDSIEAGQNRMYIQIIDKLTGETVYAGIFIITLLTLDTIFLIIIIIIGYSSSKKLLRPIKVMTDAVQSVTINQLDSRIDVRGSQNEFRDLARTFNSMLDRLQKSYEMQNQFVSDASHELRTPISVIQGYASMLDRWGKDDGKVLEESIAAIKSEAEDMKSLIEKLLFLARGDKDAQRIEKADFPINELIDEIVRETKLIDDKHEILCPRNEGIRVFADYSLMKESIRIFVDNSLKYTPEGGKVELQCYLQNNKAVITIEDTGIGIPKEDIPYVFDRFYRADKSRTKQTGGTGLGMAIAKWIILRHDGAIRVQSEVNIGTKIEVTIPIHI